MKLVLVALPGGKTLSPSTGRTGRSQERDPARRKIAPDFGDMGRRSHRSVSKVELVRHGAGRESKWRTQDLSLAGEFGNLRPSLLARPFSCAELKV
jgi:hypothetical protein